MTRSPIAQLLADGTTRLQDAGVPSPRYDAEALAAHVMGVSRAKLALLDPAVVRDGEPAYRRAIARRARREPLQHVVGSAGFRRLELAVGPGVLVPRPETELLVDAALAWLRLAGVPHPVVADLGTGSGAIALAIADECSSAQVWAVELEPAALAWAERNVALTGLAVRVAAGDMLTALPELNGAVDVVVSNPPYLPAELAAALDPEVRHYDPPQALFAVGDPLAGVRAAAEAARRLLRPGGLVVVEHGDDQGPAALACFGAGWTSATDHFDLCGRSRFVTAVRA